MVSDIVCECLVKKKMDPLHIAKVAAVFVGGFLISYELLAIVSIHDPTGMLGPMLFMVGIGLTVFFGRRLLMVEYEYAYFDGEISFDRDMVLCFETNTPGEVIINMTRVNGEDPTDPQSVSKCGLYSH